MFFLYIITCAITSPQTAKWIPAVLAPAAEIISIYLLFFYARKKYSLFLVYENSQIFSPFIEAELYNRDFGKLKWEKLFAVLPLFVLTCLQIFLLISRTKYKVLPLLILSLLCLLYALKSTLRIKNYYRNSAFYTQSAIREDELSGKGSSSKGLRGEYYAFRLFSVLPEPKHILLGILVPKRGGGFSEMDLVALTPKGIFCVEAKNRDGVFMEGENSKEKQEWLFVQGKKGNMDIRVSNIDSPLSQNLMHIRTLASYWKISYKYFFNILCFGRKASVKRAMPGRGSGLEKSGTFFFYDQKNRLYENYKNLPVIMSEELCLRLYKELSRCQMSRIKRESLIKFRKKYAADMKKAGKLKTNFYKKRAVRTKTRSRGSRLSDLR